MSAELQALADHVASSLGDAVTASAIAYDELTVVVRADEILRVVAFLRDDPQCRFISFLDIAGVDYPGREKRFDVVYHLLSPHLNHRIRLKVETDEVTPVPSIIDIFPAANWFEREAYDLYGILFSGHPDLRRILTDYGFEGYPAAQGFPAHRLRRGSLRRRTEARRLRARETQPGIPQLRLSLAVGRH